MTVRSSTIILINNVRLYSLRVMCTWHRIEGSMFVTNIANAMKTLLVSDEVRVRDIRGFL